MHLVVDAAFDEQAVLAAARNLLAARFSIRHSTVQIEAVACDVNELHGGSHFPGDAHDHK